MKKNFSLLMRGYKLLAKLIPGYFPVAAVSSLFSALLPFVNIFASAMIINAIEARNPFEQTAIIAVFAAVINLAARIIMQLLKRISSYLSAKVWWIDENPLNEKQQEMDFAQIESPDTRFMRQKIKTLRNTNGNGILMLYWTFESLITDFLTVITSIGVFAPVLLSRGKSDGFWGFINTPWFAALFLLIILGNALFSMFLTNKRTKASYSIMEEIQFPNTIGLFLMEKHVNNYQMGKDIKINRLRNCVRETLNFLTGKMEDIMGRFASTDEKYQTCTDIASNILSVVVYIFVAVRTVLGNFGIGNVVQYIGGITRFNTGFIGLSSTVAALLSNSEALSVYFEFLDKPHKIYHGTIPVEKRSDNEYEIEFHNVSFKYPGSSNYALKNLNMKLRVGQRMAVVGMNGSGKTTMVKLLCRLYDPTQGEITLNGIDIRKYDYKEYMEIFSVVFQDFKLFSFPLGQNVAASVDYDRARVMQCLEKSGIAQRVKSMPKGIDTPLYKDFDQNGVEISGGEAQKIAIARALYKNAPFIILDEPTAALDPVAEFEVYSTFNDIVNNKTAVFISHRLSSCRFCQDIAVFHDGELIQRGNHEELIADKAGKYHALWNAQAQYYVESTQ